ncbi:disease resistance RPP13-like protein 4 [Carica papaya]|uniref:disease resistance RPP13-like protein 4 n=1 Tax=Carica papaya TaxID=3649 RepID=UPI000B8C8FCB|nr:disease resistance RPP13-like protein 4 [Carica papaya]
MAAIDAMIGTLGQKLFEALSEQTRFILDFRTEFVDLKIELEFVKAYLIDMDSLKNVSNKVETVKRSLKEMRDIVLEADDILIDCILRDEYKKKGFCSSFSLSNLKFLYDTGRKLKDINLRIKKIKNILETYLNPQLSSSIKGDNSYTRFSSPNFDPYEIIEREGSVEVIKDWILKSQDELLHVGIVGMGGLGKTMIAKKIFNDKNVNDRFDKKIWVSVSQDFTEERIMKNMLEQLGYQGSFLDDLSWMMRKFNELIVKDKSYLLIMDDVWTVKFEWWNEICSCLKQSSDRNNCVIITSRNERVIVSMGHDSSHIHWPPFLDENQSWSLLCKVAFAPNKGECPSDQLKQIGMEILQKCKGLPLAIKAIGGLLASKGFYPIEWENVNNNFHELTMEKDNETSFVVASLQLSYNHLPSHLRQCLLCFSIYPEDYVINAEKLVHWWVGEGLVHNSINRDSFGISVTELGFKYLSELISRCLVEVAGPDMDGKIYNCRVHDMVRDLLIMSVKYEGLGNFDEKGKQKPTADTLWLGLSSEIAEGKSLTTSPKLRALVLMKSGSKLHFDKKVTTRYLNSIRVLDLSKIELDTSQEDLFDWLSCLKRLACLNLSGVTGLKELPSSVEKLLNLQILVLNGCTSLSKVHPSITNLKRLIILDLGSCPLLKSLPQGIEKLVRLQELSGLRLVKQDDNKSCKLIELGKLMDLRVLRINICSETEISQNELEVLSQLKKLKVLSIDTEDCTDHEISEALGWLSHPQFLEELYLKVYGSRFMPVWVNPVQLPRLRYLHLETAQFHLFEMEAISNWKQTRWNLEVLSFTLLEMKNKLVFFTDKMRETMHSLRYLVYKPVFSMKMEPFSSCPWYRFSMVNPSRPMMTSGKLISTMGKISFQDDFPVFRFRLVQPWYPNVY